MNRDEFSAVEILEDRFFRLLSNLNPLVTEEALDLLRSTIFSRATQYLSTAKMWGLVAATCPRASMFVSRNVVFALKASTQPSITSEAHDMSIGDSGKVGLLRMPLALVCPTPEGSFNDVEPRIGNRRLPNRVIRSGGVEARSS